MNILFSSDDNYARHLGVAIYSLLSHNTSIPQIRIYVIDNNISPDNIKKLNQVISSFRNAEMILIPFKKWADSLHLNMMWPISLSSYARLFYDVAYLIEFICSAFFFFFFSFGCRSCIVYGL